MICYKKYFYKLLSLVKQQTTCIDKQVACIITDKNYKILSVGFNEVIICDKDNCDK